MSRILKFRAWDREQECMVSWDDLMDVRYNERWFIDNTDKDYINCIFSDSDYILIQYIGIEDKNGNEIYEGDIIKDSFSNEGIVKFSTKEIGSCGCCYPEFIGVGYIAEDKDGDRISLNNECEIIGNIYETI